MHKIFRSNLNPDCELTHQIRRALRKKLSITEYRALIDKLEVHCEQMSTAVDAPDTMKLPANDGQAVRHHSRSEKEQKDLERAANNEAPALQTVVSVCDPAT